MKSDVLVIAPHADDEVLGCGMTIMKHVSRGDVVTVFVATDRAYDHVVESQRALWDMQYCLNACANMGVDQEGQVIFLRLHDERTEDTPYDIVVCLEDWLRKMAVMPTTVYVPWAGDANQDHRAVHRAANVALRRCGGLAGPIERILAYEVPSSTEQTWVGLPFVPNVYEVGSDELLHRKLAAFACYESEQRERPHPRSEEAITQLAAYRGSQAMASYAEAFMLMEEIRR